MLLLLALVVGPGGAALADHHGGGYGGNTNGNGDGVDTNGQQPQGGDDGGNGGDDGDGATGNPVSTEPQPWWQYKYVPACMGNSAEGTSDALCNMAVSSCPGEREIRYYAYRRLVQVNGDRGPWDSMGTECRGPGDPTGTVTPEVTPQMVIDRASALAPVSSVSVEPGDRTFVHFPTNFSTDEGGATVTVYLFGQAIPITFTPTSYQWNFGDGTTAQGAGIENAEIHQPGAVEHGYARSGAFDVTVTRVFTATFTLPDGQQVTIADQISTTSAAYTLTVGEIQSLVTGVR